MIWIFSDGSKLLKDASKGSELFEDAVKGSERLASGLLLPSSGDASEQAVVIANMPSTSKTLAIFLIVLPPFMVLTHIREYADTVGSV